MEKGRGPGLWLCGLGAPQVHHEPSMARGGRSSESGQDGTLAHRCSLAAAEKGEGEVTNPGAEGSEMIGRRTEVAAAEVPR
jgi:hypothetical protein